jgi:hypothetical protein
MLSAQKRLCRSFMPHRPCAVQCILRGGVVAQRANTHRQYNCRKCNARVFIGGCCDHGNIYCKRHSRQAQLEAGRRKSARYQDTRQGKFNHAERMKLLRLKKKLEKDHVCTALEATRRRKARLIRHRRRGKGRCHKAHQQQVRRPRPCAQKGSREQARCSRARRPESRCRREHGHHACHHRSRAHRPAVPCRKTRHRRTRCRREPSPTRPSDRSAAKLEIVTHPGCAGTELAPNLSGSAPSQEAHSDGYEIRLVQSHPAPPGIRCSFCGRSLPPLARLQTWRGSG